MPPKYDFLTEIRGDKELADKEMNEEGKRLWQPNEHDTEMIKQLMRDYPKLDYDMASTMYMFCKMQPEKAEEMVIKGNDYKWEHHKDEYYREIKDGEVFKGDEYCTIEHNFKDPDEREVLNLETGKLQKIHAKDVPKGMTTLTLGELMDYKAEQEQLKGIVEENVEAIVEEKLEKISQDTIKADG